MKRLIVRCAPSSQSAFVLFGFALFLLLAPALAHAGCSGFGTGGASSWLTGLGNFLSWLSGPVVKIIAGLVVVVLGFLVMFGEIKGFMSKVITICLGISLVVFAASWVTAFFPSIGACH